MPGALGRRGSLTAPGRPWAVSGPVPERRSMHKRARRRARRVAALESAESLPITFSIVGVQKAATTTLFRLLSAHPDVEGGADKEMRFFIQAHDWSDPPYEIYRRPLRRGGRIAGDATPAYLFWPSALPRMHAYDPDMRLMAVFRDPIERSFSQWAMERTRHANYPDLPEAIETYADVPLPPTDVDSPTPRDLQRALFSRSLYGAQLERALALFPEEQWRMFEFRAFLSEPDRHLDQVTDLLDLPRFDEYPRETQRMATPDANEGTAPTVADVERLVTRYADDLALFEQLSHVDTSAWPTRQTLDGTLSVAELHQRLCDRLGLHA